MFSTFINLFNKYLLSTYSVLGTLLADKILSKNRYGSCLHATYYLVGDTDTHQIMTYINVKLEVQQALPRR